MEKQYLDLLDEIMKNGANKSDRTRVGTKVLFGCQMRFDLRQGLAEFREKIKNDNGFAKKYGELGPVYGVDQLKELVENLKNNPFSRLPFNIASYSLLTAMLAQVCGYEVGEFIHVIGDAHIYLNHREQVQEQLGRKPKKLPTLKLNPSIKSLFDFRFEDIVLENYEPYPAIKAQLEVVKDTFHNCLEAFEEYMEKLSIPDIKRQIYRRTIADSNDTREGFEDLFLTQLLLDRDLLRKIGGGALRHLNHPHELPEVNITGGSESGWKKFEEITNSLSATEKDNFHFYQGEY
ncbi:5755_t:CDS:2 [Racocetra fulgida]|uniref:thymidylate synthase n=1 Tax=Racocetra fulgida TaxID=60492 RepID=A0A9N8YZV9_9GLOM|nr:5755_t:CDS:2 [Racocetra fulgida]